MSGLIDRSDLNTASSDVILLSDVHLRMRQAVDLLHNDRGKSVQIILDVYRLFNKYAINCAYNDKWPVNSESTRQWDNAFSALLGLTAPLINEPLLINGLVNILSEGAVRENNNDALYIVASGGEYKYRTLFVTLAVGILCSLFHRTEVHGNRSVTGCGCGKFAEADILESYTEKHPFPLEPVKEGVNLYVESQLSKHNFAFSYTQAAYPIFWRFAVSRGNAGLREPLKLAGTLASPYRSKYAYLGLWSDKLFDVAHGVCLNLYDNFVIVAAPDNVCDELLPSGGKVRHRDHETVDVSYSFEDEKARSVIETEDGIPVIKELERLYNILDPGAIESTDTLTRTRCEMAIINAAYALSVLPQNKDNTIENLKDEIKTKILCGEALKKFKDLKSLSYQ